MILQVVSIRLSIRENISRYGKLIQRPPEELGLHPRGVFERVFPVGSVKSYTKSGMCFLKNHQELYSQMDQERNYTLYIQSFCWSFGVKTCRCRYMFWKSSHVEP